MMSRVFLCRAHSRREPGYNIPGEPSLNEWHLSEKFCQGAAAAFVGSNHVAELLGSTLGLRIVCLQAYCRKNSAPVAVEFHCNRMPDTPLQRGFFCMAWYQSKEAQEMSRHIIRELRQLRPDTKCRGINKVSGSHRWVGTKMKYRDKPVGFLEDTPCPTVIVEAGYLSNEIEAAWLREPENRYAFGLAAGRGILNYLEDKDGKVPK